MAWIDWVKRGWHRIRGIDHNQARIASSVSRDVGRTNPSLMKRRPRGLSELAAVSEHLSYEIWMFITLARALSTGVFGNGAVNNAALESFTLHARVLLDFLFSDTPRPDDVVAEDFFGGPDEWRRIRGDMPPPLKQVNARVGKEVAHLTYARLVVTQETKGWPFVEIADAMNQIVDRFQSNVSHDKLGKSWNQGADSGPANGAGKVTGTT